MSNKNKSERNKEKPEKTIVEKTSSRLKSVFTKEYKHESLILLLLALVAIVLGVTLLRGILVIPSSVFLLGDYPMVFSWILLGLGIISLLLAIWPFYKPSIEEVKRVSWPTKGTMVTNTLTVFLFTLILSLFFALIDTGFSALVAWLDELANAIRF